MEFNSFCKAYGLDPKVAGQIPCPPVENGQIGIKVQMIDWCGLMKRYLESIESNFRNAPVDQDSYRLQVMQKCRDHMKKAMIELDLVHSTMKGE